MGQELTFEEVEKHYGLTEKQIFDHVEKGELNIYYKHPELREPFHIKTTGDVDSVLELKRYRETSFLNGFMPVDTSTKNLLLNFALYSTQRSKMHNYKDSCTVYIEDVYLLESEVKLLAGSVDLKTQGQKVNSKNLEEKKSYSNLTEQRDEYREEIYGLLCKKVIETYKSGVALMHHKQAKKVFLAFERGDYDQEIIEEVGGFPKRKLSQAQFIKKVGKEMQQTGFKKFVHGFSKT